MIWPFKRTVETDTKSLAQQSEELYAALGLTFTTAGGVTVSGETALRVLAVGCAIRVISEAVACLDVSVKNLVSE
ncbi:hypothetical protein [Limimaricola soesokkakensis]|uniref:hypothetical protein n=1 Tax=Limimaricola soesokkakensis TaxID=1343159 RepID=UPI003516B091